MPRSTEDDAHRGRSDEPDPRRLGVVVAGILDAHFATDAPPSALAEVFHHVPVPIHRNEHVVAAALRGDRQRVRDTGRWLVRRASDRCAVLVGLALLGADRFDEDIPMIQTIGLLADEFGALAADALRRRRDGVPALAWLAERIEGSQRIHVIEALCEHAVVCRSWLLRHARNGESFDGYFAGRVATVAHLHEAVVGSHADDQLVDHTGRLLATMADCFGMGMTLDDYPPAPAVLAAHARHLGRQEPAVHRYRTAGFIVRRLAESRPGEAFPRADVLSRYRAVLDREDWRGLARAEHLAPYDEPR